MWTKPSKKTHKGGVWQQVVPRLFVVTANLHFCVILHQDGRQLGGIGPHGSTWGMNDTKNTEINYGVAGMCEKKLQQLICINWLEDPMIDQ